MLPPLVGVAVKVTVVPAQMVVADAAMLTEGATLDVTVILIVLEVAVLGEALFSKEVITTLTAALLPSVEL